MPHTEKLSNLVQLSGVMRWLCLSLLIVVIVAGVGIGLLGALTGADWFYENAAGAGVTYYPGTIKTSTRLLIVIVNGITIFAVCRGLWSLMRLFEAFSKREILTMNTSQLLRNAGSSFLFVAIYGVIAQTMTILLLTMTNPAGERALSIGLGTEELFAILLAGTLFAVGYVLSIAADIDEENKGFV